MSSKFFTNQLHLNDKNHKVEYNVNFIDALDIVKTIEKK